MKTFRKSSLITSVALLLVAIVALGGATFAWFSTNNSATAGTLEMTATSASGLYIAETALEGTAPETGWSSKITWTDNVDSMPAVSGNASAPTAFFKTSTDNADGTWNGTDAISAANANTDFIVKKIWVKADTSDEVTLTITPTVAAGEGEGKAMKGYERIAIVDDNGAVIMSNAEETYEAFTSQAGAVEEITTETFGAQTYTGKLDTAKCFYVYMWFEGQDAECYNLNSGANFKLDLAFAI
ncbi:MAG: hypothetical protein E7566_03040 [Ruminococcaceae bacterium]|nr:hypothetical protein [Oscillospiraceae bacterium]